MKSIDVTVDGPRGRVDGAFEIDEHHQEGPEIKQWAPGYGEFYTRDGRDYELMALAVPRDALPGAPPAELTRTRRARPRYWRTRGAIDWTNGPTAVEGADRRLGVLPGRRGASAPRPAT